jgi:hypothetical protein
MRWTVLAMSLVLATAQPSQAQDTDDKKSVTFETADEVRLAGTFYRGKKNADSPCVLMLHSFKGDRSKGGWDALATALQNKGFAVLTFDFRGHGGSTSVRDKFWNFDLNRNGIKGASGLRNKGQITAGDFKNSYWPVLLNDIAAARNFLDTQNDAQKCNSSTIVVIGAAEGAGLGIGWMCHEWERRVVPSGTAVYSVGAQARIPGEDLACGIWLGPVDKSPTIGTNFRYRDWINRASQMRESTPFYVLYGKQDSASAMCVPNLMLAIRKPPDGIRSKHAVDKDEGLNTRLPGQDLIGNSALSVDQKIIAYMEDVLSKHRKHIAWKEMKSPLPGLFPLTYLNFQTPN